MKFPINRILKRVGLGPLAYMGEDMMGPPIYEGSRPDRNQRPRYNVPTDTRKSVSKWDWLRLVAYCRQLYANLGPLRSGLIDKANAAVADGWLPIYYGDNKEWGKKSEEWLSGLHLRQQGPAIRAPGRPELDQHRPVADPGRQVARPAVEILHLRRGRRAPERDTDLVVLRRQRTRARERGGRRKSGERQRRLQHPSHRTVPI